MDYFGKEIVNHFLLAYVAVGGTVGVKSLLFSFTGDTFSAFDEGYVIDFSIKQLGIDLQVTKLDFPCFAVSAV